MKTAIGKQYFYELQKIDCNCNDCKFMIRDLDRPPKKDTPTPINYGHCARFNKPVSFIPATCQLETQECFVHRKDEEVSHRERIDELAASEIEQPPTLVGELKKCWGINGYHRAEVGHPVYETKDRYIIYLTHEKGFETQIPFYKETLRQAILFYQPQTTYNEQ